MNGHEKTARWLESRRRVWAEAADNLSRIERGKSASPAAVREAIRAYPELASDLAIARREAPRGPLTRKLEQIYLELHRTLFRSPNTLRRDLRALFLHDAPAIARSLGWHIAWVALLFGGSAAAGAWLIGSFPDLVALFASEALIEYVHRGELWTDDMLNVMPSSVLAVSIFTNNIVVSLFAMCLGVLYGLGTIYIIGMNGMMLGGIFAFTAQYGLAQRLLEFIVAHGFVELSVIVVAGAIGVSLGEALARPGRITRAAAFQRATTRGAKLMAVCVLFLIGAGLIEGYVSPNPDFSFAVRLAVGLTYFVLFLLIVGGAPEVLLRRGAAPAASGSGGEPSGRVPRRARSARAHRVE